MVPKQIPGLCDWDSFDSNLSEKKNHLSYFRDSIAQANEILAHRFKQGAPVAELVRQRAELIDQYLLRVWRHNLSGAGNDVALVAVGGYGRGELHPCSDIDLLILHRDDHPKAFAEAIEAFLLFLWDIGLEVGHSVRSVRDCVEQGKADITIATNLMEARLIDGPEDLFTDMQEQTDSQHIWPGRAFFKAKLEEQVQRHRRYHDTAYNLEPNIKENPGGLRDIQVIGWVAKRHFDAVTLHDLVQHKFLTEKEYHTLIASQDFLWKIRFALHLLAGRREDRLLFDYQRNLAEQFAYKDTEHRQAVEQFMKDYYRTVMELNRLNEMLLQLFDEEILHSDEKHTSRHLNRRFQERNGYVEITYPTVFKRYPFALLEIFLLLAQNPTLRGVRAETIRAIREHRHLIDDKFRNDVRCHTLFMELLRQPHGITHELRRMNRYGILAAYLPDFAHVVGQMQHDLFHIYTVDEHTLFVVRNLRRMTVDEHAHELPFCSKLVKDIPKPELLYLAGLFHDIGKGRGGDHSEIGAKAVTEFCEHHALSAYDTRLVAWLVRYHLLMSVTAQRKDISDPEVIKLFAEQVGSREKLNYLYLLTVADIRGTNQTLWNSWKGSLLFELYMNTVRAFRHGLSYSADVDEQIDDTKQNALRQLVKSKLDKTAIEQLWGGLEDDYFLRHTIDQIVWHTKHILKHASNQPLVMARSRTQGGGVEVFVYAKDEGHAFAAITAALDRLGLSITDARITTSSSNKNLDTFIVLEKNGNMLLNTHRIDEIEQQLLTQLATTDVKQLLNNPRKPAVPRQLKHFPIQTRVHFSDDVSKHRTIMDVVAQDRPGLLANIALALIEQNITVQNAKIATFGERAEDIFFITDAAQQPIVDQAAQQALRESVIKYVDA